jgi:hypothetical protein
MPIKEIHNLFTVKCLAVSVGFDPGFHGPSEVWRTGTNKVKRDWMKKDGELRDLGYLEH